MHSKFPPPSVSLLRADMAAIRAMGGKRQSIGNHSSLLTANTFSRSRSAPSKGLTTGGNASASSASASTSTSTTSAGSMSTNSITAKTTRLKSVPLNSNIYRSKSMGYVSNVQRPRTTTPSGQRRAESPRFTPTKAEIGKIRNELAGDKQTFNNQYPVAPSPMKLAVTPSPVKQARYSTGGQSSSAMSMASPQSNSVLECLEAEIANLRAELEAEKNHSEALSKQSRELALTVDRDQKTFKIEKSKMQAQIKKLEATAAQAVADREELRKRTASEVSKLKKDLDRTEKANMVLKERLEVLETIPPPPPPTQPPKTAMKVRWNPQIDYREGSPMSPMGKAEEQEEEEEEEEEEEMEEEVEEDEEDVEEDTAVDPDLEKDLLDMYREYDVKGTGVLTKLQVSAAYQAMERTFGLSEIPLTFPDSTDTVDFQEFVNIMSALPTRLATETAICDEGK